MHALVPGLEKIDRELREITAELEYIPVIPEEQLQKIKAPFNFTNKLTEIYKEKIQWKAFICLTQHLDIFIMDGLPHLHSPRTAEYLKEIHQVPLEF
ncbi:MAG: hypothetical protein P4L79_01015 [Legionella sp.]|uniref:hypothetical protein n=1 Tax=Legionella sp. TaxID=459 RepID=UPI00284B4FC9|nr:hypothetical protein [Legionella sp.]